MLRFICVLILLLLISSPSLGQQSLVGTYKLISHELALGGINKVTLFAASGPEEAKGKISDDGNKIIFDDGRHRVTLTRK